MTSEYWVKTFAKHSRKKMKRKHEDLEGLEELEDGPNAATRSVDGLDDRLKGHVGPPTPARFETVSTSKPIVMWDLASVHGDGSDTFTLVPDAALTMTVGSDGGINDMHVKNRFVSRSHAVIVPKDDGKYDLVDVGSMNGTFVGGVRLKPNVPHRLEEGDVIEFGWSDTDQVPSRFEYRRSAATDPDEVSRKNFQEAFERSYVDGFLADRGIFCLY